MTNLPIEKAEKIIKHYGTAHQKIKLCEECAELTDRTTKHSYVIARMEEVKTAKS